MHLIVIILNSLLPRLLLIRVVCRVSRTYMKQQCGKNFVQSQAIPAQQYVIWHVNTSISVLLLQHLLSPEQYSPPKKMLEFSRRNQEDQIVKEIEEDVKQLTQEQADLEVKQFLLVMMMKSFCRILFSVGLLVETLRILKQKSGSHLANSSDKTVYFKTSKSF